MLSKLRTLLPHSQPDLYAILDIGTVEAKALLLLVAEDDAAVVGVGRQAHQPGAIVNGSIVDAKLAARACDQALAQAEALTETVVGEKLVADRAIAGISGDSLKSVCLSLTIHRQHPKESLSESELRSAVQRAERVVLEEARSQIESQPGAAGTEVGLVDADVLHILVDGYPLINTGVTGAQLDVRLSNVFAPVGYLAAVSSVVAELEMETVAILSGACAVARAPYITGHGDAIIIDVGGESTDIVLSRNGGIESVQSLPMGGGSFTRHTARLLGIPLMAAEDIKRAYACGELDQERTNELRSVLAGDVHTWIDGVQALLEDMAAQESLPSHIFLSGGGAALPDVERGVKSHNWIRVLPFTHHPQVTVVQPHSLSILTDQTRHLEGETFGVPAALAAWAVQSIRQKSTSLPQRTLRQVLHGMGLS